MEDRNPKLFQQPQTTGQIREEEEDTHQEIAAVVVHLNLSVGQAKQK